MVHINEQKIKIPYFEHFVSFFIIIWRNILLNVVVHYLCHILICTLDFFICIFRVNVSKGYIFFKVIALSLFLVIFSS